jgi:hypothetical protein
MSVKVFLHTVSFEGVNKGIPAKEFYYVSPGLLRRDYLAKVEIKFPETKKYQTI